VWDKKLFFLKRFQCQLFFFKERTSCFHSHKRCRADQYDSSERPQIQFCAISRLEVEECASPSAAS
jgi:hypothetical protein